MLYAIIPAVMLAMDQLVKYMVFQNIPLGENLPYIP